MTAGGARVGPTDREKIAAVKNSRRPRWLAGGLNVADVVERRWRDELGDVRRLIERRLDHQAPAHGARLAGVGLALRLGAWLGAEAHAAPLDEDLRVAELDDRPPGQSRQRCDRQSESMSEGRYM